MAESIPPGLVTPTEARTVSGVLHTVTADSRTARPDVNMSDFAFALERHVEERLPAPVPAWHVDRSRNDQQSCAQLMFGRDQLGPVATELLALGAAAHRLAGETADLPMPGFTHPQAAQVITPGFYLAAVVEQALHTLGQPLAMYDGIDVCPIGAGAMSGRELAWDRDRMASLLGFRAPQPHALVAVASRKWVLEITAELSVLGAGLSRFVTDLMAWGSPRLAARCGCSPRCWHTSGSGGGSLCGSARALRERLPGLRVVGADSAGSVLFGQPDRPGRLRGGLDNSLLPKNLDRRPAVEVTVTAVPGDVAGPPRGGCDRLGHVVAHAETQDKVIAALTAATAELEIVLEQTEEAQAA